jgi:hypothetical protein
LISDKVITGLDFFTYVTPVILAVGITGNAISLLVFLTNNMRKLSASVYLAALSTADLMALSNQLLSYVELTIFLFA